MVQKRRAELQQEGEGSKPLSTGKFLHFSHSLPKVKVIDDLAPAHLVIDRSPEEPELSAEEAGPPVDSETPEPRAVTESDLMYGITAAIKTFKAQLEEHFTVSNHILLIIGFIIGCD